MDASATRTHALVVGGATGLGRTVVKTLAREGHDVSVIDRLPPGEAAPVPAVVHHQADLLDPARVEQVLAEAAARRGPVRCAVFCQRFRGDAGAWEGEIETTLGATRRIVELLAERFPPGGEASIVMVGSVADRFVAAEQPAGYHAAKAGLAQLARYFAVALGPRGVRCNCVSPAIFVKEGAARGPAAGPALERVIPLRRIPTAEEIARVILFLCGPGAACVTGQEIVVDGGLSLLAQATLVRQLTETPARAGEAP